MHPVLGIGEALHLAAESARGERDAQVMQRRAAAQDQIPAIRVGGCEVAVRVGVQLQALGGEQPPPGLAVVHRRRPQRVLDGARELTASELTGPGHASPHPLRCD
jgi:hypothetical protein